MLTEQVQYQGKVGFLNEISKIVVLEMLTCANYAGFCPDSHIIILLVIITSNLWESNI